jgi:phosphoribosyl 1,2-cyclic phosphate phosphodiesterase
MQVTFLGTGTSMGIPMIGCECEVCKSTDEKNKRLRTSVWIQKEDINIIIDTGIDFRQQALRANINTIDAVLFTHHHVDHVFGLDDLRPINCMQKKRVQVFSNQHTYNHLERIYRYVFKNACHYSDIPEIDFKLIEDQSFTFRNIKIIPIPVIHGELTILGFRIGNFAYCTDVSVIPESTYSLLTGLDILVLGALRNRPHPTHFTINKAVEEAKKIGARRTYLVHLSHEIEHVSLEKSLPQDIQPAYDGLVLTSV